MTAGVQNAGNLSGASGQDFTATEQGEESRSLFALFVEQFCAHKLALVSLGLLVFLAAIAMAAPLVTGWLGVGPGDQNITNRYAPAWSQAKLSVSNQELIIEKWVAEDPARAEQLVQDARTQKAVSDSDTNEDVPFVLNEWRTSDPQGFEGFVDGAQTDAVTDFTRMIATFDTFHVLGTDELGRDVLARLIYGARISLSVAALVGLCSVILGLLFGATAGYFGGLLDNVLMRVTDALMTIPTLPLYIILAAADLSKLPLVGTLLEGENQSIVKMVVVMGSLTWMPIARIVRGSVLSIKESEFVMAARTIGMGHGSIIIGHIVPNVFGPLVVAVTLLMGEAMLIETGLSFLGLGIQPPIPSWGNMLQNALELVRTRPELAIIPGVLIFVTIIAINFVGDGLRDALDPKAIRR
jgi:peptide/nickel transport system permease protein